MKPFEAGIYWLKLGTRWTVGEYIMPADRDEDAYWIILGSNEGFATKEFVKIGKRVEPDTA